MILEKQETMNHIGSHVAQLLQSCNQEHYWKFLLMSRWEEIVGTMGTKVFIYKIHQKSLILGVNDSSWMQELHLLSGLIKDKINIILGNNQIDSIKLKYIAQSKKIIQKKQKAIILNQPTKALTPEEMHALSTIKDQELSQALVGFLQKCHQFS